MIETLLIAGSAIAIALFVRKDADGALLGLVWLLAVALSALSLLLLFK